MDLQSLQSISNSTPVSSIKQKPPGQESFWGKDGFTFGDVLDMFNPLQHLPVISKYYREQTQDDASEGSRLVGGVLFGGLLGGAAGVLTSIADSVVRHETDQDMGGHILAMAEESLGNINSSSKKEYTRVSQYLATDSKESNPFFAQTIEEHSNRFFYSPKLEITSIQRSRNWGKV